MIATRRSWAWTGHDSTTLYKVAFSVTESTRDLCLAARFALGIGGSLQTFDFFEAAASTCKETAKTTSAKDYIPVITRGHQPRTLFVVLRSLRGLKDKLKAVHGGRLVGYCSLQGPCAGGAIYRPEMMTIGETASTPEPDQARKH